MDFFQHQDAAKRNTTRLVVLFVLAIIGIIAAVYLAVMVGVTFLHSQAADGGVQPMVWWNSDMLMLVAAAILFVVSIGTTYKMIALASGGGIAVAEALGGTPVSHDTTDAKERVYVNVVEEMAIASGTPVPAIYVLNDESHINAFAAGFNRSNAVVAVTRGCLEQLSRDELQGVVAHEFSHILHGDMRLNVRLMGVLHGILLIGLLGSMLVRSMAYGRLGGRSRADGALPILALGVVLFVVGYIGVFFASLIKSGVSRQREFLADASAVQFTRNPDGIAGALKKIGGFADEAQLAAPKAEEASHMFFANALSSPFLGLMATHPPLAERIKRIDPQFSGVAGAQSQAASPGNDAAMGFAGATNTIPVDAEQVVNSIGAPTARHVAWARQQVGGIDATVAVALRTAYGARAVVYGLLLSPVQKYRDAQWQLLREHADPAVVAELGKLSGAITSIERKDMLMCVELAIGPLRQLSAPQYQVFQNNVTALIQADRKVSLFEYALSHLLRRHLGKLFGLSVEAEQKRVSLRSLANDASVVLAALAQVGHDSFEDAAVAYRQAFTTMRISAPADLDAETGLDMATLDNALTKLAAAPASFRKRLVAGAVASVSADGTVALPEAELLRAICDVLDCPLPPVIGQEAVNHS